jgi:hypothetical protein
MEFHPTLNIKLFPDENKLQKYNFKESKGNGITDPQTAGRGSLK